MKNFEILICPEVTKVTRHIQIQAIKLTNWKEALEEKNTLQTTKMKQNHLKEKHGGRLKHNL